MNVYYVDTQPSALAKSEFSSKYSFQDCAAVDTQYAQVIRDSSVTYAPAALQPGPSLVSGMTTGMAALRAPALSVVHAPLWPAQLHATFCNTTQIQYLVW